MNFFSSQLLFLLRDRIIPKFWFPQISLIRPTVGEGGRKRQREVKRDMDRLERKMTTFKWNAKTENLPSENTFKLFFELVGMFFWRTKNCHSVSLFQTIKNCWVGLNFANKISAFYCSQIRQNKHNYLI